MIGLILDALGTFFLGKLRLPLWAELPLSVLLGLANGLVSSVLLAMALGDFQDPDRTTNSMMKNAVLHPMVCIAFTLWWRYRSKSKA